MCLHTSLAIWRREFAYPPHHFLPADIVDQLAKFAEVYMENVLIANFCGNFGESSCYVTVDRLFECFNVCRRTAVAQFVEALRYGSIPDGVIGIFH
jgi:hypothetical protein